MVLQMSLTQTHFKPSLKGPPQLEDNFTHVLFGMLQINKHLLSVLLNVYRNQIRRNLADFWEFNYTLELQDWW